MNILSVTRLLPVADNPAQGIFVKRRLDGMRCHAAQHTLQPVPWFPGLRPLPDWFEQPLDDNVTHVRMFYLPGVFKRLDANWMASALLPWVRRRHAERAVDVIDAHWGYPEAVAVSKISRRLDIPFTVTLRGHEVDYLADSAFKNMLIKAFDQASACICVSHSLSDLLCEQGIDPSKVYVVHNAVDRSLFHPGDRSQARLRLGIDAEERIVLSVGQILPGKRHLDLLAAFETVASSCERTRLVIAGSTSASESHTKEVTRVIREKGLSARVSLLGALPPDQLADYYKAADVFCLMTEREGCCNAVLESLASGLPVVTTPAGDNRYFIKDGVNGYIVKHGAVEAASTRMRQLLRSAPTASAISASLPLGDWATVGEKVIDIMEQSAARYRGNRDTT